MPMERATSSLRRAALAAAVALALCAPAPASAAAADEPDPVLNIVVPSMIDLDRVGYLALPAQTNPESIVVGIPCGMLEMCGQDPCLCGPVDEYGSCACNGTQRVVPHYTVEFAEEGVATAVEWDGVTYLVPLSSGQVDAVVTAELPHYQSRSAHVTVYVAPFGFEDFLKVLGALLALAAVAAALFFGVRALVRLAKRRASAQGAGAASAQGSLADGEDLTCGSALARRDKRRRRRPGRDGEEQDGRRDK